MDMFSVKIIWAGCQLAWSALCLGTSKLNSVMSLIQHSFPRALKNTKQFSDAYVDLQKILSLRGKLAKWQYSDVFGDWVSSKMFRLIKGNTDFKILKRMQSPKSKLLVTNPKGQAGKFFHQASLFLNIQGSYGAKIHSILLSTIGGYK